MMRLNYKNIFVKACFLTGALLMLPSCNDFLDREPLSNVTPQQYFQNANHLAAYSISKYNNIFPFHSGWNAGVENGDRDTDNMVVGGFNSGLFQKGQWKVPNDGSGWDFSMIRYCNYFFEQVLPKVEEGTISGSPDEINQYVGEMYFIRALTYFGKLQAFGDFPIIKEVLPDDKIVMIEKSVREPRNLVARFILEDLDKAINLLYDKGFKKNTRINKQCALLIKSRVALYEGTFEKYHKSTGRVPGDANWPGKTIHPDFNTDIDGEISFFLTQSMAAAKEVGGNIVLTTNTHKTNPSKIDDIGWNPYFEMFADYDMSDNSEILFWKQYKYEGALNISHKALAYLTTGGNNGVLKNYVDAFLMKDGLPYYAASSNEPYEGDISIMKVKENRDERLQLFIIGEEDELPLSTGNNETKIVKFQAPLITYTIPEQIDKTGYRIRKCFSYTSNVNTHASSVSYTTGCVIYRGVEAMLNYMEASYLQNGTIDNTADKYWKAIRERAGVDTDYNKTIAATDMSQEESWGKYSAGELVDATMYNIRRERRCEFIGEAKRMADLKRWRSMDQMLTTRFVPKGFNLWANAYKWYDGSRTEENFSAVVSDGTSGANVSMQSQGTYLLPYAIQQGNNEAYNGYTWAKANYLSPVPVKQIKILSEDESTIDGSVLYQNPYWPNEIGGSAIE